MIIHQSIKMGLLLMSLYCLLGFQVAAQTTAMEWYDQAIKATDPKDQVTYFSKALDSGLAEKLRFAAFALRAAALRDLELYDRAIDDLNKAIQLEPNQSILYQGRAKTLFKMGRYKDAILDFTKWIQLKKPQKDNPYFERGLCYKYTKAYEKAGKDFTLALKYCKDECEYYYMHRGDCGVALKYYDRAISDYEKFMELRPERTDILFKLADVYSETEQYQRALDLYRKVIAVTDDAFLDINFKMGNALFGLEEYEAAIEAYSVLATSCEGSYCSKLFNNRGAAYTKLEEYKKALDDFNAMLKLDPNDNLGYYHRAWVQKKLGNAVAAMKDIDRSIELCENECYRNYDVKAYLHFKQQEYQKAIDYWEKMKAIAPASYQSELDDTEEARRLLKE